MKCRESSQINCSATWQDIGPWMYLIKLMKLKTSFAKKKKSKLKKS